MSLLSVVQDVCAVVGVERPVSVISGLNTNRTMQEMLALATEMAQRIAYDAGHDWTALKATETLWGDGVLNPGTGVVEGTSSFLLPVGYKRMLLTTQLRSSVAPRDPLLFVSDYDEWVTRRMNNDVEGHGEWTIVADRLEIWPVPMGPVIAVPPDPSKDQPATQIKFTYLDKYCIRYGAEPGGTGDTFVNDTDHYRLDERLLKLGMTWQWKAQKGSPYAEDMGSFSDALAMAMGKDKPSPILIGGRPIRGYNVTVDPAGWTWPFTDSVGPSL